MPPADNQRVAIEAFEKQLEMPKRCALQTLDTLASHEGVAVNAHEAFTELVFKGLEWLVQQHLAALVTQGNVFMVGDKIDHLIQRDQFDAFACTRTDLAARAAAAFGTTGRAA